jgi:nickel/cobalt transporter (NicO) family protein
MFKYLILSFLISSKLFACSMCTMFVPRVEVSTIIYAKKEATTFNVKWQFHPEFNQALLVYDVNNNGKFERAERDAIKQSIENYIIPINYLLNIEYIPKNKEFSKNYIDKFTPNFSKLSFNDENGAMVYEFNVDSPFVLQKDYKLYIAHYDEGGNFDFIMKDIILKGYEGFKRIQPKLAHSTIEFYQTNQNTNALKTKKDQTSALLPPKVLPIKEIPQKAISQKEIQDITLLQYLSAKLQKIKDLLEQNLQDIKENNSIMSYLWLLVFSFAYGVLHALGPGHGKTLISSYFLGQDRSYMKAFTISSMIGIVHTFSAFMLTIIVYYIVGTLLSSFITDVEQMAVKVSAGIIILIALYLLFQKFTKKEKPLAFSASATMQPSFVKMSAPQTIHQNNLSCGCNACKTQSTDIGIILAAGIVPCPGTVTIFIFTMGLGIYFVGFLSAVFMSLGMASIIFLTALISVKIRKSSSTNNTIVKLLEYGSVFFILLLGVILLII